MKKTYYFFCFILLVTTAIIKGQSYSFTQTSYTTTGYPTNILKGDFNNDNKMDIVMQNQYGLTTYLQAASNTFSIMATSYTPAIQMIACADFNGDNNTDVVCDNNILFLGNGSGSFSVVSTNQNFTTITSLTSDFNHDGKVDLVNVVSASNSTLNVFLGTGNGNFNAPISYSVMGNTPNWQGYPNTTNSERIISTDLNNDTKQDLIISTAVSSGTTTIGTISVYLGNGDGTLNASNTYTYNIDALCLKISDFNNDGKKDIVFNSQSNVVVLTGDGLGNFSSYANQTINSLSIDVGDYNNDGKQDIVNFSFQGGFICSFPNTVSIIDNTGSGFAVNSNTFSITNFYGAFNPIITDDFNDDGKMDLAVNTYSCTPTLTICYNTTTIPLSSVVTIGNSSCFNLCNGATTVTAMGGTGTYNMSLSNGTIISSTNPAVFSNLCAGSYSYSVEDGNQTVVGTFNINQPSNFVLNTGATNNLICNGESTQIYGMGSGGTPPYSYDWSPSSFLGAGPHTASPSISTIYSVSATDANGCVDNNTISVIVDNTCQDVWPGDVNSDGTANNLDVLELGLHYAQTGTPRTTINNNWQSFHADNWAGTISNGKNLNHSDCNGDGTINDNDTLAIYNNYGLTHAFKQSNVEATNPQLSIVPNESAILMGYWGSADIFLGEASNPITNINGVAFTVDFDNSLIETGSIYLEYTNSFVDVSNQNLKFRKLDFANGKLYTATTHTNNINVSGNGKIGTLHYKIKYPLTQTYTLQIGLSQANQSDASGIITPLTSGSASVEVINGVVGVKNLSNDNVISVSPNPATNELTVRGSSEIEKVEITNITGQVILSEHANSKNHKLNLENISNGVYFVKVYNSSKQVSIRKLVVQK